MKFTIGMTVYGPEVARSGLSQALDDFIRGNTGFEIVERFFAMHSRRSIESFYSLTGSTGGEHWPLVLDLFDMRPACVTFWSGIDALQVLQGLKGHTHPARAVLSTIRGQFYCDNPVANLIHVSDDEDVMKAEIRILQDRSTGRDARGWAASNAGRITHSSFHVLLNVLGNVEPVNDASCRGTALTNARHCYGRVMRLISGTSLDKPVQQYLKGERSGLDAVLRTDPALASWDRLMLEAGLFALPSWLERFERNHMEGGWQDGKQNITCSSQGLPSAAPDTPRKDEGK